jgi:VanZ family protein
VATKLTGGCEGVRGAQPPELERLQTEVVVQSIYARVDFIETRFYFFKTQIHFFKTRIDALLHFFETRVDGFLHFLKTRDHLAAQVFYGFFYPRLEFFAVLFLFDCRRVYAP